MEQILCFQFVKAIPIPVPVLWFGSSLNVNIVTALIIDYKFPTAHLLGKLFAP
jgi:hypothetical protein